MPNRIYALLVGINDYPPEVRKLAGCLNDVDHFQAYLRQHVDQPANLAIEVLKDADATRANIIERFRKHLAQAQSGDVAVFHYCGHGARSESSAEFREFCPDGMDEGLVCYDSRRPGGHDLADKELAALIAEVARNQAQLAVLLDCCHSGSGTRSVDAFRGLTPRVTHDQRKDRALETYLDGHYARMLETKGGVFIPASRHILLAACERGQLAQESAACNGVFTTTLIDVLEKAGGALSYADLFLRCREAVRSRAMDQEPQFEAFEGFDATGGFLGRNVTRGRPRFSVAFTGGKWSANCGALHGVPAGAETGATFELYRDGAANGPAGTAKAIQVLAQSSELQLDFEGDTSLRYGARLTSLPEAPLAVEFAGDAAIREAIEQALQADRSIPIVLTEEPAAERYAIAADAERVTLSQKDPERTIVYAERFRSAPAEVCSLLMPALNDVARWERTLALQNRGTAMNTSLVETVFAEQLDDGSEHVHAGEALTLDYRRVNGAWLPIHGKIKVRNRTAQPLHMALLYVSSEFGIEVMHNEVLAPGEGWQTILATTADQSFFLAEGVDESIDNFKLIVSTERLDGFLFEQKPLEIGEELHATRSFGNAPRSVGNARKLVHKNEWFTRRLCIRVARRLNEVATTDVALANGSIVVKGHPSITANLSIGDKESATRGMGAGSVFHLALEERGLSLVNFASTRGGDSSVLELTDIRNAAGLTNEPLQIELKVPLGENEAIVPLVYDGQHVLLGGASETGADGITRVSIDHLPEAADQRRSLGGSLKLYFFKTYLKRENVNKLRWVELKADGTAQHHTAGVAEKVAGARRVLLLVHGIIGDTEGMAGGVHACGLDQHFDLVLAYDYENLNTPIADTARMLKADLQGVGLHESDDKQFTLLVHSMGGLVSRWFIEREGGKHVVDHLVMCGTPNNGSPFGRVDQARNVFETLAAVSINYMPAFIPFACTALLLFSRSKKLTPALEQMNPDSDFIRTLNESPDPGIPYTILAGDVARYEESGDALFARLLAKAGRSDAFGRLFADQPNDIAVGVESILRVDEARALPPKHVGVACHHLNYFVSEPGQLALQQVAW